MAQKPAENGQKNTVFPHLPALDEHGLVIQPGKLLEASVLVPHFTSFPR